MWAAPHSPFSTFQTRQLDLRLTQPVYNGGHTEALATKYRRSTTSKSARAQTLASVETTVSSGGRPGVFIDWALPRDQSLVEVNRNNEAPVLKSSSMVTLRPISRRRGDPHRRRPGRIVVGLAGDRQPYRRRRPARDQSRSTYVRAVGHPPGRLIPPTERPALAGDARRGACASRRPNNPNVIAASPAEGRGARQCRRGARPTAAANLDHRRSGTAASRRRSPCGRHSAKIPLRWSRK